ncbi:hypothetical protein VFPPC_04758 [Pochonia chlamydosporia 170]|uniref:Uncharacterized protein n=1 Tax=Pochonia chlamydosporia 170 TaxID=1380566 RepID=A0A179FU43_METCM|nr:hypothetical protein VFPPC_04758 [Pochonia chlamydosporia 170]OAQ68529.1 hypothetical protein VFPPC_04758 [Pochonia chlamydosporia 170]
MARVAPFVMGNQEIRHSNRMLVLPSWHRNEALKSTLSGASNLAPWLAADLWAVLGIAKEASPSRPTNAGHAQKEAEEVWCVMQFSGDLKQNLRRQITGAALEFRFPVSWPSAID